MNFKPATEWQSSCLQGQFVDSYEKLVKVFGPEHCDGDGYKVQAEWMLEFEDGTYATIYDYKQGDTYNGDGAGIPKEKVTSWHIGGMEKAAVQRVKDAIMSYVEPVLAIAHEDGVTDVTWREAPVIDYQI